MKRFAAPEFWQAYWKLPKQIQKLADKNFSLLKSDLSHPSFQFKQVGNYRSVRVGAHYRALGIESENGDAVVWFWIGTHAQYDHLLRR